MAARGSLWTLLRRCRAPGPVQTRTAPVQTRTGPGQHRCSSSLPAFPPPGSWSRLSRLPHRDLYRLSVTDPDRFWGSAAGRLHWEDPFTRVRDCDLSTGKIRWFLGGKINVSVNCLDVHVDKHPDRVALIWERDEPGTEVKVTYRYHTPAPSGAPLRPEGQTGASDEEHLYTADSSSSADDLLLINITWCPS
ncbi:Acetyl-coenzyme A synthetase 2-like, mitochondrial [Liparis tanakae]|uniref:Acetyl-coenzyme A synthetase 2-like, mitochondrial n=1 Tax=Liparis tanakae TaxID=230148 RepID=A0A4Z2ED70_9TELE|nr:Acetyl-coenzyme A synthetase 2-like, mitochondrial [Liparis tanakae]